MRPAFSSTRQAAAFAITIAIALLLPAVIGRTHLLDRRDVYPSNAQKYGSFPYIQQTIFDRTGDLDMVFIGSSHIWTAINTPYVQKQFSQKLARDAQVQSLGWPWPGFDSLYFIARDLLEHRRVRVMVISDEGIAPEDAHVRSMSWFRIGENSDALQGLPPKFQAELYGQAMLGAPRHLLSAARPNLLEDPLHCRPNFWNSYYRAPNIAENLGSLRAQLAFGSRYAAFTPYEAHSKATSADVVLYSDATRETFKITGPPTQPYQLHFARKLAQLCQQHGTRLIMLHTPHYSEREEPQIPERVAWAKELAAPIDLVGIAPAVLFSGIPADDVQKLFYENGHLNQNGQELFTPLVTPKLLELYVDTINK